MEGEIWKIATIGQAEGQEIVSIFYFSTGSLPAEESWNHANMREIAELWDARFKAVMDPLLSADYVGTEHSVTVVNVRNETISDFAETIANSAVGEVAGGSDTVALAAIVAQRCTAYSSGPGIRVPKKSYLALGPLASANIGDNGLLLWNTSEKASVATMCFTPLVGITGDMLGETFRPVRVGVPNQDNIPAVGVVAAAQVREYTRPRKSRLFRANGR